MIGALLLALVLPYFEVSIEPENRNFDTHFTIVNGSAEKQRARINVWTDHNRPVLWYTTLLDPHASKTISMRELLVNGIVDICASPGEKLPIRMREEVRCELTSGCKATGCTPRMGERHAHAIGYVTIDIVEDCMDLTPPDAPSYTAKSSDALTGTFEQIANGSVIASGPLGDRPLARPRMPHDPLARRPPRECPPLSPGEPHW